MFPGMTAAAQQPTGPRSAWREYLTELGLNSGLKLTLDPGDAASYASGQTWTDLSGNAYNFLRGDTSSSETSDPSFSGTAGNQSSSEYWTFDGGDYFTLGQANPSWVDNIHKSGAKFSILEWVYVDNVSTAQNFGAIGAAEFTSGGGFTFAGSSSVTRAVGIGIYKNGTNNAATYTKRTTALANNNAWNLLGVSVDIGAGNVILTINDTVETYTSQSYDTPTSSAAGSTLRIGRTGNTGGYSPATTRLSGVAIWEGVALTSAQMQAVFSASRGKFGV